MTKQKLLPLRTGKVGLLGSSTASLSAAPFDDPTWEMWATGPGAHLDPQFETKFQSWFEIHDMSENDPEYGNVLNPGYYHWLEKVAKTKTVYYKPPLYKNLKGEVLPWDEMLERHCGYFLDSTVAWMLAYLLDYYEPTEVGLWGIDFATEHERILQRKGAKHFLELLKHKGVKIVIPDVSDMSFDPMPYPDVPKMRRRINRQLALMETEGMKNDRALEDFRAKARDLELHQERIRGTMEAMEFFKNNWT